VSFPSAVVFPRIEVFEVNAIFANDPLSSLFGNKDLHHLEDNERQLCIPLALKVLNFGAKRI
jgi:hypothetical protein